MEIKDVERLVDKNVRDRFWSKVDKGKSNVFYGGERCWEWIAALDSHGYGSFRIEKKIILAHRASWLFTHGVFPKIALMHLCDNTRCCNPTHLKEGTQIQNMLDMVSKGRSSTKERNGRHKLSVLQVVEIRQKIKNGEISDKIISESYNVDRRTIYKIRNNLSWK